MKSSKRKACIVAALGFAVTLWADAVSAQGVVLPGVGAINRSMAGATVAAPIDAAGAMHWNPAAIRGLEESEIMFGAEFLYPRTKLSSFVPAGGVAPGVPPVPLAGTTTSNSGVAALPTSALVYHSQTSDVTYGLGVYTIGGFGANYAASTSNPVLTPQPPIGIGAGSAMSRVTLIQIAPTAAFQLTDQLSFGLAPTITIADLAVDPGIFASPDDANGDTFFTYPPATHSRLHWGLGFQVGLYYENDGGWSFGVSYKSPQWIEDFEFNSMDELGLPRKIGLDIDYPMILSGGVAYRGIDRLLLALDVRYIDYKNTDGFGNPTGYDVTGAATGLGWRSVMAVAAGAQYQAHDRLSLRFGYLYNDNPIRGPDTHFNIVSTAIFQHAIFLGATARCNESLSLSLAYLHAFRNSVSGPYTTPLGVIPGSSVTASQVTDSLIASVNVHF